MLRTASIFAVLATAVCQPTRTETLTLTGTVTKTLPTATATFSKTLPTPTNTKTLPTPTRTMTLPTRTVSMTLPPTNAPTTASTPIPTTVGAVQQDAAVQFVVNMELTDLVAQISAITTAATGALGSTTAVACVNICELAATGNALSGNCFTCAGVAQSRGVAVLAPARYRTALTGRTALTQALAQTRLAASIRAIIVAAGGTFESVTVTLTAIATDSDDGLSGGAIAGIVIGCVAFVVIIVVVVYCCCCKQEAGEAAEDSSAEEEENKETSPDQV